MTKRLAAVALILLLTAPLYADFASAARAIEAQRGVHRNWIPFLGLARAAVWMVHPEGVHDFQLVTFRGADGIDPHVLRGVMSREIGAGFAPLVQTWSRRSNEWTFIYARPSKNDDHIELVVLTHDDEDTVLVRVEVDSDVVAREVNKHPREVTKLARE